MQPSSLRLDLDAVAILVGESPKPTFTKQKDKATVATILERRLDQLAHLELLEQDTFRDTLDDDDEERRSQLRTGQAALELLSRVDRSVTSSSTLLSVNDLNHLSKLGGIVARWSIAIHLPDSDSDSDSLLIPNPFLKPRSSSRLGLARRHNDDDDDSLGRNTARLIEIVVSNNRSPLTRIVMPQVVMPLIAALVNLSTIRRDDDDERDKWDRSLESLLTLYVPPLPPTRYIFVSTSWQKTDPLPL